MLCRNMSAGYQCTCIPTEPGIDEVLPQRQNISKYVKKSALEWDETSSRP